MRHSTFKFNSGCLPIGVHLIFIGGKNELHFFVDEMDLKLNRVA